MSKIVLMMDGDPQWQEVERARQYQAERLGRAEGETFLADLLPLPANSVGDWPYPELFPDKDSYERQVLPGRIQALATLAQRHRPSFVFCYGKGTGTITAGSFPRWSTTSLSTGRRPKSGARHQARW